jgi:hypothetical protein
VHDAATGNHPVDLVRPDTLSETQTVTMQDLALEQIGDRGQPDMRMRPHIERAAGREFDRSHLVEEDERADATSLRGRQHPSHDDAVAQGTLRGNDSRLDHHRILTGTIVRRAK